MLIRPLRPFAAILEGQAPWWRIGTSGVLVLAGYLGLVVAALSLGGAAIARTDGAPERKLVVTLLDRVPAPDSPTSAGPAVVAPERRAPLQPTAAQSKPAPAPRVRPSRSAPLAVLPTAEQSASTTAAPPAPPIPAAHGGGEPSTALGTASTPRAPASSAIGPSAAKPSAETVLPFTDGMTRPKLIEMIPPEYTREARDANVRGLFLAKCVITTEGMLQRCRVVKGLPMMDRAVLSALARWRYTPVIYQGKPVAVDYVIQVRLAGP